MPRGNASQSKVHYQGKEEDFVVYIDDIETLQKWKADKSIPLAQFVSAFKIFVTHKYESLMSCCNSYPITMFWAANDVIPSHRHGAQNAYDEASQATLENEFGNKSTEDERMRKILTDGDLQNTEVSRIGGSSTASTNESLHMSLDRRASWT